MKLIHEHLKNDSAVNSESSSNEGSHLQMSSSATTPTMAPPSGKFYCTVLQCHLQMSILGSTSHPVSRHSVAKATPQCAVYKVQRKHYMHLAYVCSIFVPDISWRQRESRPFCPYRGYSKSNKFMLCSALSAKRQSFQSVHVELL